MKNGTLNIIPERGSCVVAAVNRQEGARRMPCGMKIQVAPCVKNVPVMIMFNGMASNVRITRRGLKPGGKPHRNSPVGLIRLLC